jgi:2-aminoethylphosphonate-pyruvate transaminase
VRTEGWSRTLSLDLFDQWRVLEETGQFRFTPPTHALLAFKQALDELAAEGGVAGRAARYRGNHEILVAGMRALGFTPYLAPALQSPILAAFRYPADERFDFPTFYDRLNDLGFVIYPGKVSRAACFRIGTIGRIGPEDVRALLRAIKQALVDLLQDRFPATPPALPSVGSGSP